MREGKKFPENCNDLINLFIFHIYKTPHTKQKQTPLSFSQAIITIFTILYEIKECKIVILFLLIKLWFIFVLYIGNEKSEANDEDGLSCWESFC